MAAEDYKVSYFGIRGLAEPIRLLLIDNGIPFKDDQFTHEQWPAIKPTMPFGQGPCFYHGGIPLAQSGAILRHLGRKHDLYGSDLNQSAFIDMFYEGIVDARKKYYDFIYRDAETRDAFLTNIKIELTKLADLGTKHPTFHPLKIGSFVNGDKISFVDYVFFEFLDTLLTLEPSVLDSLETLKAFHKAMSSRPKIAAYVSSEKRKAMKINGNGKQ